MQIYKDLSLNLNKDCYTAGPPNRDILMLCCHNTAGPNDFNPPGQSFAQSLALSDTAARYLTSNDRQASVHWLVGGEACNAPIYLIVPEKYTAYQCGGNPPQYPSKWTDPSTRTIYVGYDLNVVSIGIELLGQPGEVVGPKQLASLKMLVRDILGRHPLLAQPERIVAHADLEGDRTDGKNWVAYARGWAMIANLPFGVTADSLGNLYFPDTKCTVGFGFKDYFLTLGGNVPQGDLAAAITRGVKEYGLPLTNEAKNPATGLVEQTFERYCLQYNPAADPAWRTVGRDIGRIYLANRPPA
jgi:hypothetical protein